MAATVYRKTNLDAVLKRLNREIGKIEGDVQKGLSLGMAEIKGDSMENTPVDTGNLKGSHYLVSGKGGTNELGGGNFNTRDASGARVAAEHQGHVSEAKSRVDGKRYPFCEIGCTAHYAEVVHENLEAHHPSGKAKFMEDAIRAKQKKLVDVIKRFAAR